MKQTAEDKAVENARKEWNKPENIAKRRADALEVSIRFYTPGSLYELALMKTDMFGWAYLAPPPYRKA